MHRCAPRRLLVVARTGLLLTGLLLAACANDPAPSPAASADGTAPVSGEITVLAAASLTDAFGDLAAAFRAANPKADITFSFAASSSLATQIAQGAPADVFASADAANMDKVVASGAATSATVFATNSLQIIVSRDNPKAIAGLADLARPGVVYVTAAPGVPIGAYAAQALAKAGVTVTPKSLEADVKAIVTKVTLGEADAGIVYSTDVIAAGTKARGIAIPVSQNVTASYPIAVLDDARNARGAAAFVAFVTSETGRAVLARHGFGAP